MLHTTHHTPSLVLGGVTNRFYGSKVMETFVFKGVEYHDAWFEVLKEDINVSKQNIYEALDVLRIDHERCMQTGEPEPFKELLMHARTKNGSSVPVVLFRNTGRNDNQFAFAQLEVLPIHAHYRLNIDDDNSRRRKACFFRDSDAVNTMNALGVVEYTILNHETGRGRDVKNFDPKTITFDTENSSYTKAKLELTMNGEHFDFDVSLFNGVQYLKCYYDAMSLDETENALIEQDTAPNLYWVRNDEWRPLWVHLDEMTDDGVENTKRMRKVTGLMLRCLRRDYESGIANPVDDEKAEFGKRFGKYHPGYDPDTNYLDA